MDSSYLKKLDHVHPLVKNRALLLVSKLEEIGYFPIITQGYRSVAEQNALYAKGRTAPGSVVTNARGGESWHNWGLAIDLGFLDKSGNLTYTVDWDTVGKIGESLGMEWGGRWKQFPDRPHFQIIGDLSLRQLLASSNAQELINERMEKITPITTEVKKSVSSWAVEAVEASKKKGIEDWSNPQQPVDGLLLKNVLFKLGLIQEDKQPTKEQLITVLHRLHAF